jgi:hypothetical protein
MKRDRANTWQFYEVDIDHGVTTPLSGAVRTALLDNIEAEIGNGTVLDIQAILL